MTGPRLQWRPLHQGLCWDGGGGGAGECVRLARPRGASLPHPHPDLDPSPEEGGGVVLCCSRVSPPLCPALPALPPSFSFTRSSPQPRPTATLGYCFRVRVTSGVRDLRPGAGPGRAAFTMLLSRGRAAGGAPAQCLPSPQICPPRGNLPLLPALPLQALLLPRQIFPKSKSQSTGHPHGAIESVSPNAVRMASDCVTSKRFCRFLHLYSGYDFFFSSVNFRWVI